MREILTESDARRLLESALAASDAEDAFASLGGGASALTRFGAGQITQNVHRQQVVLAVTAKRGLRSGSATTDDLSADGVRRAAARADEIARLAPEDPEAVPSLGAQEYARIDSWVDATAGNSPEDRARAAARAIEIGRGMDLVPSGTVSSSDDFAALAAKTGLWAYHRSTTAGFSVTMRTPDGTGASRAQAEDHRDVGAIDVEALSRRAAERARASANPQEIPPGDYEVVLEPQAVADVLRYMFWSMDARESDEGRSFFAGKTGERVVDERVSLRTEPGHALLRHRPFTGEGLPVAPTAWIDAGVLRALSTSRYWARRTNRAPTAGVQSVVLPGDEAATVDDLVRSVRRGLLISRFWYIRMVDPKRILVTGLTRDGTFLVEDGRVRGPAINYRFNDSPVSVLSNVAEMSRAEKAGDVVVPGLRVTRFTLSSPSRAV